MVGSWTHRGQVAATRKRPALRGTGLDRGVGHVRDPARGLVGARSSGLLLIADPAGAAPSALCPVQPMDTRMIMRTGEGVEPRADGGLAWSPACGTWSGCVHQVRELMGRQGTGRVLESLNDGVDVCHMRHPILGGSGSPVARRGPGGQGEGRASSPPAAPLSSRRPSTVDFYVTAAPERPR